MSNLQIEEMNKIIARFMGYFFNAGKFYADGKGQSGWFKDAKYHRDWNSLMDVWYKFVDLRFENPDHQLKHSELKTTIGYAILYGQIQLAHTNLFEGIEWYYKTKT